MSPRILLTGSSGQVGWELRRSLAPFGEVIAADRALLNLEDPAQAAAAVRHFRPDILVNPAAYTAVDRAESEPELAQRVNADSVRAMAAVCAELGSLFVHYSTDYVFDGSKPTPYLETDATGPVSVYGRTKLAGEQALAATGCRHLILRTSWVYGGRGKNFLLTMLKLARERDSLGVVADQFGAPTWSRTIADATAQLLRLIPAAATPPVPLIHLTSAGRTSWQAFAAQIVRGGSARQLTRDVPVLPITTADYPTPAKRPAQSCLAGTLAASAYGICMPDWQRALDLCLDDMAAAGIRA
ncbi:MAG: dTDP-4-dehydrorhamnose reductase [Nevskia sp.]